MTLETTKLRKTFVRVHVHEACTLLFGVDSLSSSPGVMRCCPDLSGSNRPRSRCGTQLAKGRTTLLRPTGKEYRLYASGTPSVLVKDLISESPVIYVEGVASASLEKMLVDATIAPEFEFARGSELYSIYENADQMYRIGKKTMLRYAARRGKKEEIEKLIESTML